MKRALLLAAAAVTASTTGACGNYSNEDIDFQLSVPKSDELSTRLPFQPSVPPDAAEYYRTTREVGMAFNTTVVEMTSLMDSVRVTQPSARNGDERIWGPYRQRADHNWETRLRMSHDPASADPAFRYVLEFHRAAPADGPWQPLLSGTFGLLRNHGEMVLDTSQARASGYPVGQFHELLRLTLRYERRQSPVQLEMIIENTPESGSPMTTYRYLENADGSGELSFISQRPSPRLALDVSSRWNPTGAGRADARIDDGSTSTGKPLGVDCWAADGHATYVLRELGAHREEGTAGSCVFGPP